MDQPLSDHEMQIKDWSQRQLVNLDYCMWAYVMFWNRSVASISLGLDRQSTTGGISEMLD